MTEEFETEALHYLLGQMEPGRRAEFERQLDEDPSAAAAFKACADAYARFACDSAPAEPMSATDQRVALTAILTATHPAKPASTAQRGKVIPWARFAWPAAAAALLALNLIQLQRPLQPTTPTNREGPSVAQPADRGTLASGPAPTIGTRERIEDGAEADAFGTIAAQAPVAPDATGKSAPRNTARQLERLSTDYAELQRNHAALRADYDAIVRHLASRTVVDRGVGRLAAMELVDAASYARGERKGLLDVARGILTEPGVVIAESTLPPKDDDSTVGGVGITVDPSRPGEEVAAAASPYAWAVFDEKENRGYLNVYNLPTVAGGRSLQLWVKSLDAVTYQRVGEVPSKFQDGTGSLYYTLPAGSSPPAEILITEEPKDTAPAVPTGPVVLRGP